MSQIARKEKVMEQYSEMKDGVQTGTQSVKKDKNGEHDEYRRSMSRIEQRGPSPYTSYYRTGCTTTNDPTAAIDANEQEFAQTRKMAEEYSGEVMRRAKSSGSTRRVVKMSNEFLQVDRDEIEEVLKSSYQLETSRRLLFLESLDLFGSWLPSDIKLLSASSEIVEHPSNTVVIRDTREQQQCVHFIISGQCKVVRQIPIKITSLPFARERITLAAVDDDDEIKKDIKIDSKNERIKNTFLVIKILKEGSYFGIDEDIGKSSIITNTKTRLLKVPRTSLKNREKGQFFNHINDMAMKQYPNRAETFKRYMVQLKWGNYKKELVKEIASHRHGRLTASLRDVPKCLVGTS